MIMKLHLEVNKGGNSPYEIRLMSKVIVDKG